MKKKKAKGEAAPKPAASKELMEKRKEYLKQLQEQRTREKEELSRMLGKKSSSLRHTGGGQKKDLGLNFARFQLAVLHFRRVLPEAGGFRLEEIAERQHEAWKHRITKQILVFAQQRYGQQRPESCSFDNSRRR